MAIDTSAFTEEAYELLSELENSLLELEENPQDKDLINRVFRAMHTIKGSGAMFGFDAVSAFTHEVETVFDQVRNGQMPVTRTLIDLTLGARDQIRAMLDAAGGGEPADEANAQRIIAGLRSLASGGTPAATINAPAASAPAPVASAAAPADGRVSYRITFRPQERIFAFGTNPLLLLDELRGLGACRVVAITDNLPPLEELDPEKCYTSWHIFLTTDAGENAIRDVFIFVESECDLRITLLGADDGLTEGGIKRLGEILVEHGDIPADKLNQVLQEQRPLGERLVDAGLVQVGKVRAALVEQTLVKEQRDKRQQTEAASVRVPSEKLDILVDLVGELVTVQARLNQTAGSLQDHDLLLIAEEVERLTGELRDNTMSIRMLPIGTTFSKFRRLVRDLAKDLGKEVEMTTDGEETELDKTVIDQLNDPLVHIIRNSMDHGLERPEERRAAGKPTQGRVHLVAEHSGAHVLITVRDDGRGLDAAKLKSKAIEKGIIPPDAELTEKEAHQLIMAAGFSTAEKVTNLSGRGVGMDVVVRSIEALRGSIEVNSTKGQGTAITLKLPLTLAIIEGLLVKIANDHYVLPLASVEECVELTPEVIERAHGRHVINVRGEIVPFIRLRNHFAIPGQCDTIEQIVIAQVEERRVGFVVDHVIGQHQTVIKTLGKSFKDSEEFSGATILGNGTVALILDLTKMVKEVEREEDEALG